MARFIPLCENDTKELRKEIGLPVTKKLFYWEKTETAVWMQTAVSGYEVVDEYKPSESKSLLITLKGGKQVRILGDFFADMQKPSFVSDMENCDGE